jgi:hypothetical protein
MCFGWGGSGSPESPKLRPALDLDPDLDPDPDRLLSRGAGGELHPASRSSAPASLLSL